MNGLERPALSATELMAWNDKMTAGWRSFVTEHPAVLEVGCDIYRAKTVGELLQHIVAAELRYAERLAGLEATEYDRIPFGTAEEIFATHERALALLRDLLDDENYDWNIELEFGTLTAGRRRAPRRVIFFHAMLHGVRHYAQLGTLVRQAGFAPRLPMDYLMMDAVAI